MVKNRILRPENENERKIAMLATLLEPEFRCT
jgi:hypothetical protein